MTTSRKMKWAGNIARVSDMTFGGNEIGVGHSRGFYLHGKTRLHKPEPWRYLNPRSQLFVWEYTVSQINRRRCLRTLLHVESAFLTFCVWGVLGTVCCCVYCKHFDFQSFAVDYSRLCKRCLVRPTGSLLLPQWSLTMNTIKYRVLLVRCLTVQFKLRRFYCIEAVVQSPAWNSGDFLVQISSRSLALSAKEVRGFNRSLRAYSGIGAFDFPRSLLFTLYGLSYWQRR